LYISYQKEATMTGTTPLTTAPSRAARCFLPAAAALSILLGTGPAAAQAVDPSDDSTAADSSWFAQYHPAATDTLSAGAYQGWKQFQLNCSRCHGQDAEGTSFAPSLVQALGKDGPVQTESEFLTIACNGIPGTGMPSWCKLGLEKAQLQQIYLYIKGRADGTIHPGHPAEKSDSTSAG
jgi:mono/diheme cytochrome c family protein